MVEDLTEVQKLRRKLADAVRILARHIESHPELKPSQEHLRLVLKCQELERQLDRLDKSTKDTPKGVDKQ